MCGVFALIRTQSERKSATYEVAETISETLYRALLSLQHRGQDSAGISTYCFSQNNFISKKSSGLVNQVFQLEDLKDLQGEMGIAHNRYATIGGAHSNNIQPFVTGFPFGLAMAHNGNLLNYHDLKREIENLTSIKFLSSSDLEILMQLFIQAYLKLEQSSSKSMQSFDLERGVLATKEVLQKANGGYALVGMVADRGIFGLRDPQGIRPLSLGKKETDSGVQYALSSETVAFNYTGFKWVRDIEPSEFIFITSHGEISSHILKQVPKKSPCMFEWVYFSGAESSVEKRSVYASRLNLGRVLATKIKQKVDLSTIDLVMPVPDTSRTASISLAEELKLPYREGLIKYRYSQRSFILNSQKKREEAVELKLSPVPSEIKGKSILLVDDSLVRGTTSKQIIKLLKRYEAKKVVLGITCPPLRHPCFYGVDFPTSGELIANHKTVEEMASWIGVDQLIFLDEQDLKQSIQLENLCTACVSGVYPTSTEFACEFSKHALGARDENSFSKEKDKDINKESAQ